MTKKDTNLNFEEIANECGLQDKIESQTVIANIESLKDKYSKFELVEIYNYFLNQALSVDIMMHLIRCLDAYRSKTSLKVFTNILLFKNFDSDEISKENYVNVRAMCAKAIGNQKDTDYVSALLYCLNNKDEHYRVRLACAEALGRIGDKYAVAPLIDIIKDDEEKSVYLKESAATALGILGDIRAISPLVNILETKNGIVDKFSFLKERVIEALGKMGFSNDNRVFNAIKKSLSDDSPQVRIDAIEALMNSEHPKAYETIKKCLIEDNNYEVKKNALIALYNLSDRTILDEVINSTDYSDALKIEAVKILEEYEDE
jgi:HEAT repeat protein